MINDHLSQSQRIAQANDHQSWSNENGLVLLPDIHEQNIIVTKNRHRILILSHSKPVKLNSYFQVQLPLSQVSFVESGTSRNYVDLS